MPTLEELAQALNRKRILQGISYSSVPTVKKESSTMVYEPRDIQDDAPFTQVSTHTDNSTNDVDNSNTMTTNNIDLSTTSDADQSATIDNSVTTNDTIIDNSIINTNQSTTNNRWQYIGDGMYYNWDTNETVSGPIIPNYKPGDIIMQDPGSIVIASNSVIMNNDNISKPITQNNQETPFEIPWSDGANSLANALNDLHQRGIDAEVKDDGEGNPIIVITQQGASQLTDEQRSAFTNALREHSKPTQLSITPMQHVFKTNDIDVGNMQHFLDSALAHGIPMRITSGVDQRPNNPNSQHPLGNAIDVTPLEGEDWETFEKRWTPEFLNWMKENGYTIYDELNSSASKDWTAPHRHIAKMTS